MVFAFVRRSYFFIINDKTVNKSPSKIMFRATVLAATVTNRLGKITDLDHKKGKGLGKRAANPHQIFLRVSRAFFP